MRLSRPVALLSLVSSTLVAGVVTTAGPSSAAIDDESFYPRWCDGALEDFAPPCIESAMVEGMSVGEGSEDWSIESTGKLTDGTDDYFQFQVLAQGDAALGTGDDWSVTFDTGSLNPRYTEGFAGRPVVERTADGGGLFHVTYSASPVVTTTGCEDGGAWPPACTHTATSWTTQLSGEVHDKSDLGNGYDRSQNVDEVSGVFLETAGDGSPVLTSDMANSHQYDDGGTLRTFVGQARFRLPYSFLRDDFGIPDPETLTPSSLVGTVRKPDGTLSAGTWNVAQDTAGGGIYVDVSGITFSVKKLRLKTGTITPTKPTQVSATRTRATRGFVDFEPSTPRGAQVTGYAGKCVAASGHTVTATAANIVRFTGLKAGKSYDCKVRARSEVGPGPWSGWVRMSRTVFDG